MNTPPGPDTHCLGISGAPALKDENPPGLGTRCLGISGAPALKDEPPPQGWAHAVSGSQGPQPSRMKAPPGPGIRCLGISGARRESAPSSPRRGSEMPVRVGWSPAPGLHTPRRVHAEIHTHSLARAHPAPRTHVRTRAGSRPPPTARVPTSPCVTQTCHPETQGDQGGHTTPTPQGPCPTSASGSGS